MTRTIPGLRKVDCRQYKNRAWRDFADVVSPEVPVVIRAAGRTMRLWAFPEDLQTLALGHVLLEICPDGSRPVRHGGAADGEFAFEMIAEPWPGSRSEPGSEPGSGPGTGQGPAPWILEADLVMDRMAEFISAGGRWEDTGCFHRAGLLDPVSGSFVRMTEDIGRHNCLDRLAGWCLDKGRDPRGLALFVSARATASLVAKAARAGFPVLVSRSASTTAGLDAAREAGLALLGFARENRFTVFADPGGRIADPGGGS